MAKLTKFRFRSLVFTIESVLWAGVLIGALFSFVAVLNEDSNLAASAHIFLGLSLLSYAAVYGLKAFLDRKKQMDLATDGASALLVLASALACLIFGSSTIVLSIVGTVFFSVIALRRIPKLMVQHKVRNILVSVLVWACCAVLITALFTEEPGAPQRLTDILVIGLATLLISICFVLAVAFSRIRFGLLLKIIRKTFVAETFFGLITLILIFSLIFRLLEPGVFKSYGDGLWYSFATVTTIGYGDRAAEGLITRVLSVILGIYGIIVVAVITSVIVNFYQETIKNEQETEEISTPEEKPDENQKE